MANRQLEDVDPPAHSTRASARAQNRSRQPDDEAESSANTQRESIDELAQLDEEIREAQRLIEIEDKKRLLASLKLRLAGAARQRMDSVGPSLPSIDNPEDGDYTSEDDGMTLDTTPTTSSKRRRSTADGRSTAKRSRNAPLKPRVPQLYTGQSIQALTEFIRTCEDAFRFYPDDYSEAEKRHYAIAYISGPPRDAWEKRRESKGDDVDWKDFCQFLRDQKQTPSTRERTRFERYTKASQRPNQTVVEYATYLESLEVDFEKLSDRKRRDHFVSTLRLELKRALLDRPSEIDTYEKAVDLAVIVEENGRLPSRATKPSVDRRNDTKDSSPDKPSNLPFRGPKKPHRGGRGSDKQLGLRRTTVESLSRSNTTPLGSNSKESRDERAKKNQCFNCGKEGHWAAQCKRLDSASKN